MQTAALVGIGVSILFVIAFLEAIPAAAASNSLTPFAVAVLSIMPMAYAFWLTAQTFKRFLKVFGRNSYRLAYFLSLFGMGFFAAAPVALAAWVSSQQPTAPPPDLPGGLLTRAASYFGGLVTAAIFAKAYMDLAEDTSTKYFSYLAIALVLYALLSFLQALDAIIGLIALVLFFVAVREARGELARRMAELNPRRSTTEPPNRRSGV